VDSLRKKDYNFLESLEKWMKEIETILQNNRISECAAIAGYRSKIIAPLFSESQKRSVKKRQMQLASEIMYELQDTVLSVIKPHETKVNEARDLLIHLLSIVKQSTSLKYTDQTNFQEFILSIWNLCSTHEQLKQGTIKILTLISQIDALRIIAEEIEIVEWR
jgi:predicted RNA-binding protein with EMAP domain